MRLEALSAQLTFDSKSDAQSIAQVRLLSFETEYIDSSDVKTLHNVLSLSAKTRSMFNFLSATDKFLLNLVNFCCFLLGIGIL